MSDPLSVTIDTVAPLVTITSLGSASDPTPRIKVKATDPQFGFASPATVYLDVDVDHDGFFTGSEIGYASGTRGSDGIASIDLAPVLIAGTYTIQARATDKAGNEGTSAAKSVVIQQETDVLTALQYSPGQVSAGAELAFLGNVTTSLAFDLGLLAATCGCLAPAAYYNSATADPRPIVQVTLGTANSVAALPETLYVTLTWDGTAVATATYSTAGFEPGDPITLAFQVPAQSTGRHRYTVAVLGDYTNPAYQDVTASVSDTTFVVDLRVSDFGAGWTYNTSRLFPVPADVANGLPAGWLLYNPWQAVTGVRAGRSTPITGPAGTPSRSGTPACSP